MIRRLLLLSLGAFCVLPPTAAQDSVIRVNVRLVRLLATVKNSAGALIGSLNKTDFSV